jgi:hypothetical protein
MAEATDLAALQKRINEDPALKKRFLAKPSATLKQEGLKLTPKQSRRVEDLVKRVKTPGAEVPGAGKAPADLRAITITIGIDF